MTKVTIEVGESDEMLEKVARRYGKMTSAQVLLPKAWADCKVVCIKKGVPK